MVQDTKMTVYEAMKLMTPEELKVFIYVRKEFHGGMRKLAEFLQSEYEPDRKPEGKDEHT